jgi:multiple antibiotic resistance protein
MTHWLEKILLAWIPLFVAIDPVGLVPLFLTMTQQTGQKSRRLIANHATWTAGIIAVIFMFLGKFIFRALGITTADFQIAGGLILFILAAGDMVGNEAKIYPLPEDVGIVPLGLPIIAGPAMLTSLLIQVETIGPLPTLIALALNMVIVYYAFKYCDLLARRIGTRAMRATSKIVSLLLAAIAISMIRRGWQSL